MPHPAFRPSPRYLALCLLIALCCGLGGCAGLPGVPSGRDSAFSLTSADDTPLARAVAAPAGTAPALSGALPIDDGRDAFAIRAALADAATTSLDLQYYIWHPDRTGRLLMERVWQAAQRGVRVRLLIDDNGSAGMDELLSLAATQPNLQVRLFNPFVHRGWHLIDFIADFDRVNRRMHNKAFIADGRVALTGGRNIGDEYFAAGGNMAFADLDALLAGPIVAQMSASFDSYWNSPLAYDAAALIAPPAGDPTQRLQALFEQLHAEPPTARYLARLRESGLVRQLESNTLPFEWTTVRLAADPPDKLLGEGASESTRDHIRRTLGISESELNLVSAYFVPTDSGVAALTALRERGVRVRVLTNSLAATDVAAVHAGYAHSRIALLKAGVELYELKPERNARVPRSQRAEAAADALIEGTELGTSLGNGSKGSNNTRLRLGSGGSSSASLHAKTFGIDDRRLYVGSFNLDPRSAKLNSELGVVIDSPKMAASLSNAFETVIPQRAYRVQLGEDGDSLVWIEHTAEGGRSYTTEPETSVWRRLGVGLLSLLPIESLL